MDHKGWKRMRFKADLPALFDEIVNRTNARESPGIALGLNIIKVALNKISLRAIELDDAIILEELEVIGVVNKEELRE